MDPLLLSLFEKTRLTDKQRRVYLSLLQLGQATISRIAVHAELKRPNTYVIMDELETMGYVHPVVNSKKKMYAASDPSKIASELKQSAKSFEEMLPYLQAVQHKSGKPYVRYYDGMSGLKEAFSQIYRPKDARYITSIARDNVVMPEEVVRWQKSYLIGQARPGSKHILTDTSDDRAFARILDKSKQDARYLRKDVVLNVDIVLAANTIFLTSFEEGVHVSVIKSASMYKALCLLFDLAWETLANSPKDLP